MARKQPLRNFGAFTDDSIPDLDRLRGALRARTKEQLIALVLSLAQEDRSWARRLALEYTEDTSVDARELMLNYIRRVSIAGSIPYEYTHAAMRGIEIVLDRALDEESPLNAFQLYQAAISVCMDLLRMVNEAADSVVECISSIVDTVEELAEDSLYNLGKADRQGLFDLIFGEARSPRYDRWDDWRQDLLHACVPFCDLPECRRLFEDYLRMPLDTLPYTERKHEGEVRRLVQMAIIERFDGGQASADFVEHNLESPDFRQMALDRAKEDVDYTRVLELAQAGVKADAGFYGLVDRWEEYAYKAYKALGDTENIRRVARKQVINNINLYEDLKGTYPASEWPQALDELLSELQDQPFWSKTYEKVLIKENLQDKLLSYCRQKPDKIFDLYTHFDKSYDAQLNEIFIDTVRAHAAAANKRTKYWNVCQELKNYKRAFGAENATRLLRELQDANQQGPAFLDELSKLGW